MDTVTVQVEAGQPPRWPSCCIQCGAADGLHELELPVATFSAFLAGRSDRVTARLGGALACRRCAKTLRRGWWWEYGRGVVQSMAGALVFLLVRPAVGWMLAIVAAMVVGGILGVLSARPRVLVRDRSDGRLQLTFGSLEAARRFRELNPPARTAA